MSAKKKIFPKNLKIHNNGPKRHGKQIKNEWTTTTTLKLMIKTNWKKCLALGNCQGSLLFNLNFRYSNILQRLAENCCYYCALILEPHDPSSFIEYSYNVSIKPNALTNFNKLLGVENDNSMSSAWYASWCFLLAYINVIKFIPMIHFHCLGIYLMDSMWFQA